MKIVIVNPNFYGFSTVEPPLNLAYLSAGAIKLEHEVIIIDAFALNLNAEEAALEVLKNSPDVVGITSTTPQICEALDIAKNIKKTAKNIFMIFGGAHPTVLPDETLNSGVVDAVIREEGFITFPNLLRALTQKGDLSEIDGLSWINENSEIVHNPDRELLMDLDLLELPNWDNFQLDLYKSPTKKHRTYFPIITTLGCPYACIYCFQAKKKFRLRSIGKVVDEIEYLIDRYGAKEIEIIEDNFTLDENHARRFCEEIILRKIKIAWNLPGGIRVDRVSEGLIELMKESGCYALSFGVESGSQKTLDSVKKEITLPEIKKAVALVRKAGMRINLFAMVGLPYEREDDMMQTIKLAVELNTDYVQFQIAIPYPGTQLYKMVEREGKFLTHDWSKFDRYSGEAIFELGTTKEEVERVFKKAIASFYLQPRFLLKKIFRDPINFVKISKSFFHQRNVLDYIFACSRRD